MSIELKVAIDENMSQDGTKRGQLILEPLYRGFGHTMGNILRRVLLARIEGTAVTHVRVLGANHEFSTLNGVSEDILNIILNLKNLIIKMEGDEPQTLKIEAKGPATVTAADIQCPTGVEVMNPELEVSNLSTDGSLNMEITVAKGFGYVPAEEHEEIVAVDVIPVDSVFTPIKNVSYSVEPVAGLNGQANKFDKLILDVWAESSVSISDALGQAAAQVVELMNALIDFTGQKVGTIKTVEEVSESQEQEENDKAASVSVEELELSVRSYNCLKRASINTLADLLKLTDFDLMNIKNFGKKSAEEVLDKLAEMGYNLRSRDNSMSAGIEF